jgi:uncharacterized protein (DUF58 family)
MRFLWFLCLVISLALTVFYSESPFVWAMTAALLMMPLVSFILRIIASRFVTAQIKAPDPFVFSGEEFDVFIDFRNRSILPVASLTAEVEISSAYSEEIETAAMSLSGKSTGQMIFRLKAPHASVAAVKIRGIWSSSHNKGFFIKIKYQNDLVHIPVIPSEMKDPDNVPSDIREQTERRLEEIAAKIRTQSGEFSGIRLFSDGDRESRIHWKLSAKSEELLVREFGEQTLPSVLLIVLPTDIENTKPEITDRVFIDAKKFASLFAAEGIPCNMILQGYDQAPRDASDSRMINRSLAGMIYLLFTREKQESLTHIENSAAFDIVIAVNPEVKPIEE